MGRSPKIVLDKDELEKKLNDTGFNITQTAREFGVSKNVIYNNCRDYGIKIPQQESFLHGRRPKK